MADRVLQHIEKKEKQKNSPTKTEQVKLSGGKFDSSKELYALIGRLHGYYQKLNLSEEDVNYYVFRYGSNTEKLFQLMSDYDSQYCDKEQRNILAELRFTIEYEMVASLVDFYDRRTSYLLFNLDKITRTLDMVAKEMASILQWDQTKTETEKRNMHYLIKKALTFNEE